MITAVPPELVQQPLSFFAKKAGPRKHHLIEKSQELDGSFTGQGEIGRELAGIGKVRNFQNYSKFLERNNNSLAAVQLIQEDLGNTISRLTDFIDAIVYKSDRFSTEEGYSFAKGLDENNKTWYELKGPDLELYKYWKQAKFDQKLGIEPGQWTNNSLVHTIDLRDPSVAPKASYFQEIKYQIGNRGTERCTKLVQLKESDVWSKPSLDVVEKDPGRKFSYRFFLGDGDFYKA